MGAIGVAAQRCWRLSSCGGGLLGGVIHADDLEGAGEPVPVVPRPPVLVEVDPEAVGLRGLPLDDEALLFERVGAVDSLSISVNGEEEIVAVVE